MREAKKCSILTAPRGTNRKHKFMDSKPTAQQLDTLRNLASVAEKLGYTESSKCGFVTYAKAKTSGADMEEVNSRIHGIREIIRTYQGSQFADAIA